MSSSISDKDAAMQENLERLEELNSTMEGMLSIERTTISETFNLLRTYMSTHKDPLLWAEDSAQNPFIKQSTTKKKKSFFCC